MEWLIGLIAGAVGGASSRRAAGSGGRAESGSVPSLGSPAINAITGAIGGGATGGIIQALTSGGIDFGQIAGQLVGGGVAGAIVTAVVGLAMQQLAKSKA